MKFDNKILIIGGGGYVGSMLVPYLIEKGYFVSVIDLFIYGEDTIDEHKNYKKGILYLIIAYIIAFLLGNLLYYNVLQKTNEVTKVSFILIVFNTIISLILTYFIRGERINLKSLLGILVAVLGVSILLLY